MTIIYSKQEELEKKIIFLYGSLDNYFNQRTQKKNSYTTLKSTWKKNYVKIFTKNELELIHFKYLVYSGKLIHNDIITIFNNEADVFDFIVV